MPGKRITDLQVIKYKTLRGEHSQEAAAAKSGISVASARRVEAATVLPSQRPPRHWRTRADPLAAVWDTEVVPMLEGAPSLMAVTLLEELQRRHPEQFGDSVLRTLQRRVGQWRAEHGDEREIYFAQEHPPGRLGLSDFTVADALDISVGGLALPHRLYQFALAHSGWRHVRVVLGGESFQSLADGLQDALWMAGGVPEEHRTDSLSAAFNNLAERACLRPLPARRTVDFEEVDARVSKFGVFTAKSVLYSVPSRLAGHRLKVRLHSTHLDAWLGGVKVFECERLYASTAERHPRRIDWRHMLPSLKRKPGAFARWVLRDAMFPRSEYAWAWTQISARLPERSACRLMVELLDLADRANVVAELAGVLAGLQARDELPDIDELRHRFVPRQPAMPEVQVVLPATDVYDELLEAA